MTIVVRSGLVPLSRLEPGPRLLKLILSLSPPSRSLERSVATMTSILLMSRAPTLQGQSQHCNQLEWFALDQTYRILDPSFIPTADPRAILMKAPFRLQESRIVVAPLHHNQHWTAVTADLVGGKWQFYNSAHAPDQAGVPEYIESLSQYLSGCAANVEIAQVWTFECHDKPRQLNEYDCGIHIIAWILGQVLALPLPSALNTKLWRQVNMLLIRGRATATPGNAVPKMVEWHGHPDSGALRLHSQPIEELSPTHTSLADIRDLYFHHRTILVTSKSAAADACCT